MKLSFRIVTLAVVCSAFSSVAWGQGAPAAAPASAAPAAPTMAVIDVAKIFKNHQRFMQAMNDIKKEIEDFDTFVKGEQQKLKTTSEQLQQFRPGTTEYKQREEYLARMGSELQVKIGLKKKEFLETEARTYFQYYREIEQSVANFARLNKISFVLRFNSEDMKEDDRSSVLQGVNKAVVYYNPSYDITNYILQDLNRGGTTTPASTPPANATGVRQPVGPAPPQRTAINPGVQPR